MRVLKSLLCFAGISNASVCTGDEIVEDSETMCSGVMQGIWIPICALNNTQFVVEDLHMGSDTDCIGIEQGDNYEFMVDGDKCNIKPTVEDSKLVYTSEITGTKGVLGPIITRQYQFVSTNNSEPIVFKFL